jgi:5-deoxy-5-amino-3-dehydroquinate synthase
VRVTVDLGHRAYDVVMGAGVRRDLASLIQARAPRARAAAIITSGSLRRQPWFDLDTGVEQHVVEVPEGEAAKDWTELGRLCESLAELGLSRYDVVVGVGGGAVTDVAGLAAALYQRGLAVVHVPTSLVAQVDAAIGGKTAVNLTSGKNLVGAFHQPVGVLCDTETLTTLSERERIGGLGEIAKCWLLEDRRAADLATTPLSSLVTMAVQLKAGLVMLDERDGNQRALLNYGHTLGHALELLALEREADELRHGEAVAIGLAYAVRLAHALSRVGSREVANHDQVLRALGLPARLPSFASTNALVTAMGRDKKTHHDLTFVLPGPTGFEVVRRVEPRVVAEVLDQFRGES